MIYAPFNLSAAVVTDYGFLNTAALSSVFSVRSLLKSDTADKNSTSLASVSLESCTLACIFVLLY